MATQNPPELTNSKAVNLRSIISQQGEPSTNSNSVPPLPRKEDAPHEAGRDGEKAQSPRQSQPKNADSISSKRSNRRGESPPSSSNYRKDRKNGRSPRRHDSPRETRDRHNSPDRSPRRYDRRSPERSYRRHSPHRRSPHRSPRRDSRDRYYRNERRRSSSPEHRYAGKYRDDRRRYRKSPPRHRRNSRERRYHRRRDSSSSERYYREDKHRHRRGDRTKKTEDIHPYFKKQNAVRAEDQDQFWDGFQWVAKTRADYDKEQNEKLQAARRNDPLAGQAARDEQERLRLKKLAQTKTVIIENLSLDLGIMPKDIVRFLKERLRFLGETGDLKIVDIDMNPFNHKVNNNCVSVQVSDIFMVARLLRLDGTDCLGEKLRVRKKGEETVTNNAQSSAIAIQALMSLTGSKRKAENDGPTNETQVNASLKTLTPSPIIKISNVFDRESQMTPELYTELYDDMEEELSAVPLLDRIKIVRTGEERFGAEVGSVFVEFKDKKSAQLALEKLRGRVYDYRPIQVCFIEEDLYYRDLCIK